MYMYMDIYISCMCAYDIDTDEYHTYMFFPSLHPKQTHALCSTQRVSRTAHSAGPQIYKPSAEQAGLPNGSDHKYISHLRTAHSAGDTHRESSSMYETRVYVSV